MDCRMPICDVRLKREARRALRVRLFLQSCIAHRTSQIPRTRPGYSFTEVMFAVVVLGIGFIMIAAMFPVAIQQTATTSEETNAAAIARGGVNYLKSIATNANMPPTDANPADAAPVAPFIATGTPLAPPNTGSWEAMRGNVILSNDPRYGFVALYRREAGLSIAQVFIIATQVRARSRYDDTDTDNPTGGVGNLVARPVEVTVTKNGGGTGIHWMAIADRDPGGIEGAKDAVAEGAYVIIGIDPGRIPPATGTPPGTFNGRVYRIGAQATDAVGALVADTWTLQPGNEYQTLVQPGPDLKLGTSDDIDWDIGDDAVAWIVGREYNTETPVPTASNPHDFRGPAQDIALYSSFIQVR